MAGNHNLDGQRLFIIGVEPTRASGTDSLGGHHLDLEAEAAVAEDGNE